MSQQEFSYFDPEQETVYQPRNINGDADEQRQEEQRPPAYYVTPEQSMLRGEKLMPTSAAKTRSHWGGAAFFVLLMLIGVLIWGTQSFTSSPGYTVYPGFQNHDGQPSYYGHDHDNDGNQGFQGGQGPAAPQTFTISGQAKVVISNAAENIHITVGDSNTVALSESNTDPTGNAQSRVVANPVGTNEVDIMGDQSGANSSSANTSENDLNITVPSLADIQIINNIGDITINGVSGQVHAATIQGSIQILQGTMSGSSILHAYGNISFSGALDPKGNYNMQADSGSVNLTLPNDTTFHLHAKSGIDSVNNEFPGDSVGNMPQADLTVTATGGSINIQKANP